MISKSTTTHHAERDEILRRTLNGARWMLYLSATALGAGFFTNVILGRIGAETLGFYSMLMLLVSMIQTFFVFGGSNVLVNFLPSLSAEQKPRYVFSYTVIAYAAGAVFLAVCLLFPSVMELVFRTELNVPIGRYLMILVPIILAQAMVWAILQAELEGTVLAISHNSVSWFYFVIVGLLAWAGVVGARSENGIDGYIFVAVVLANVASFGIGAVFLKREYFRVRSVQRSWYLPEGFWRFTFALHFGTLFNFMISNAAPLFILRELGLRELGYFRAAAVFAAFVNWVPAVFDKSFYPSFCNLVSKKLPTDEVYGRFSRLNAMSSGLVALMLILFTRELLGIFGKEFSDGAYFLLIMLAAGYLISTPFIQVNFALVTAHLKTPHTMAAYAIGAGSGVLLYSVLVPQFGLMGIALAFMALQIIMFILSAVLTWHVTRSPFPTRAYLITLSSMCFGFVGAQFFGAVSMHNTTIKVGLFASFVFMVLATGLMRKEELKEILLVLLPKSLLPGGMK